MYLRALELYGFKSFPEKTTLVFDKPVTAIVGPNGSGKSNIADALQWVMGEQSTKVLRGGKMEDVIFGGTEKRGQVGFAEVSLTLDNSDRRLPGDCNEVQVTRRYYRSGESEYYINRKLVRLKDINELFMDTGLGREGYSIIGQGKIDAILSAKSTDRREIFEEAAGISRFRHRKEESERKLERAEDDLLRVNDKIAELELQVEPLRRQSETAKKYLILRDELRGLEISLWLYDLEAIAERTKKLEQDFISSSAELEKARSELEELYAAGEKFSQRMREKDVEAESVRERISQTELKISEEESAAAVLRANLSHSRENIDRINEEIKRREGQASGIQGQIQERRERTREIDAENGQLSEELKKLRERSEAIFKNEGDAEEKLSELTRRASDTADELSEKRSELSSITASLQELGDRSRTLDSELGQQRDKLGEAKTRQAENAAACQKADDKAESLHNVVKGYTMRADSLRKKAETAASEKTRIEMEYNALRSRRQLLFDMEREYEGYSKAVKTVMKEASRGTLRGVHGPAGELLKAPDKYALAVETALGAAVQNIIVSSEGDGKNVINLLKRQNAGRVTCLPMNVMRGSRINERGLDSEEGFEGVAFDLVSFDDEYRDIYLNLLGRTAIVDDMDSAIRIARKYSHRFRIVTLDGQVINAGGSMTGGSTSKNTGILSRANELKALTEREAVMSAELKAAAQGLDEVKRALGAAEYELKVSTDELRAAEEALVKLSAEREHYKLLLESLEMRLEELQGEKQAVAKRNSELILRRDSAESRIAELQKAAQDIRALLDAQAGGREKLNEQRQMIASQEAELREKRASLQAEKSTQTAAIAELEALCTELSGGRESQQAAIDDLKAKCEDILSEISRRDETIAGLREITAGYKRKIADISSAKLSIEAERAKSDRETQEKNKQLLSLERESARIEQRRQAAEMEEKQIIDKLWDNYELSRSAALEQRQELESIPAAKRRTGELRKEMSSLGTPNIGAIEEFERVNTRYTYLTEQRDDIEKSRTELLGIIRDITTNMEGIFKEEFNRINQSFKETFLELFGGGKASLELEDPNDVLGCGIEIKVQPPGKTLKTITLLSGGEKAFVAIALYYAILRIRPTPFVVMDEIEAALDEANVIRVSNYMRKLSDKTQFLTITHRRGTMEEADVLYGVTMQEQGVSKVLMVDLDEAERTIKQSK
ncbi:MAG: chromosome segregation protein SMC [Oscillospiraceae bacterium]